MTPLQRSKQARKLDEVRAERDQLRGILAGMQEGVLVLDGDARIALANPALRKMLLLSGDVIGQAAREAIQHRELRRFLIDAHATSKEVSREIELTTLEPLVALVRVAPIVGVPGSMFAVLVDVTEIRRLESLRRDFVANVSHELRTPVTAVRSAAETLQMAMDNDPDAAGMFVDIIDRNAARLHGLVEDLLDLSRIESRELKLKLQELELGLVFEQVVELFQDRAAKKRIRLSQQTPPELACAYSDPHALEELLSNLVDNAVKYCGEADSVHLRAIDEGDWIRVFVEDTGPGIDPRHLPRLFERFYRVDTGRSRELGGTGLGLSIVKHLVEVLGGEVGVESTPGQGTRFHLTVAKPPG